MIVLFSLMVAPYCYFLYGYPSYSRLGVCGWMDRLFCKNGFLFQKLSRVSVYLAIKTTSWNPLVNFVLRP